MTRHGWKRKTDPTRGTKTAPSSSTADAVPGAPAPEMAWANTLLFLLFMLVVIWVYWEPITSGKELVAPDLGPESVRIEQKNFPAGMAGCWQAWDFGAPQMPLMPTPARLLLLKSLSPEVYRYAAFMLNTVLLYLAMVYFLRGMGLRWGPVLTASMAMAFVGQTFSIVAAGHLGKFGMMPFVVLTLAFLNRAALRQSFLFYALAGVTAAATMFEQMDLAIIFGFVETAYVLMGILRGRHVTAGFKYWIRQLAGMAVFGGIFILVALPVLQSSWEILGRARLQQISASNQAPWNYVTGWSLPPEEIVEFVAPSIYGIETGDRRAPYWGLTGPVTGEDGVRQRQSNLRQHNVYLGVVVVVFACFAFMIVLRRLRCAAAVSADVWFWASIWMVGLLLALGRYGFLYHLFYKLPVVSMIRCPIKFTHLIELATVVLFAVGLDILSRHLSVQRTTGSASVSGKDLPALGKGIIWVSGVATVVCFSGMILVIVSQDALFSLWKNLGLEHYRGALLFQMAGALARSGLLFAVCAAVFAAARRYASRAATGTMVTLLIALITAIDMGAAARKYVKVTDYFSVMYARTSLIRRLESQSGASRVALFINEPLTMRLHRAFMYYGIQFVWMPGSGAVPTPASFEALGTKNPFRYLQLWNATCIFSDTRRIQDLLNQRVVLPVAFYDLQPDGDGVAVVESRQGSGQYVLASLPGALPRASIFYRWKEVRNNEIEAVLQDPGWNCQASVLVEGNIDACLEKTDSTPMVVSNTVYGVFSVRMDFDTPRPGVLLLNDNYDYSWHAFIDGQKISTLKCNGIMTGIAVPAGRHAVTVKYDGPYRVASLVQVLTVVAVVLAAAAYGLVGIPKKLHAS